MSFGFADDTEKSMLVDTIEELREEAEKAREQGEYRRAGELYDRVADKVELVAELESGSRSKERLETALRLRRTAQALDPDRETPERFKELADGRRPGSDNGRSESEGETVTEEESSTRSETGSSEGSSGGKFEFREPGHGFDDVVGMEDVKQEFEDKVFDVIEERETRKGYNIDESVNGLLLYGPPGVGKSYISEAAAAEFDGNFLKIGAGEIKNKYLGETESNVRELFDQAVSSEPCLIVIDEIDRLASDRGENHSSSSKPDMVSAFLDEIEELEGCDAVVVGTTNYSDRIDDAFKRPGRFSQEIYVPLPDARMRFKLMRDWLQKCDPSNVASTDIDLRKVAESTEGYTAADLVENGGLLYEAGLVAYKNDEPISQKHLVYGYRKTDPSVDDVEKWR